MKPHTQLFLFVTLITLLAIAPLNHNRTPIAQASGYSIAGRVTDGSGAPIEGVTITAEIQTQIHMLFLPLTLKHIDSSTTSYTGFEQAPLVGAESRNTVLHQEAGIPEESSLFRSDQLVQKIDPRDLTTYTATTDANGDYTLSDLPAGTYLVVPSQAGQTFTPLSLTVSVPPDAIHQDFQIDAPPSLLFDSVLYVAGGLSKAEVLDNDSLDLGNEYYEDFTLETFVYVSDLSDEGWLTLFYKPDSFSVLIKFGSDTPDLIFAYLTTYPVPPYEQEYELKSQPLELTVGWHHIAVVWDNEFSEDVDALSIYFDGIRVANSNDALPYPGPIEMTPGLFTSIHPLDIGLSMEAFFEEARISDIVRYEGEAYTVPTAPFEPDAETRALWHFDEPAGSTLFEDVSSYANDLTGYEGAQTYTFP